MQIKRTLFILTSLCAISAYSFAFFFSPLIYQQHSFTIMIDPAGDAQMAGRTIDNSFERGLTLQFAQKLKEVLEYRYRGLRCIISREAGEIAAPLQNANYANRINVDLYMSVNFYYESQAKPRLYLYTFSNNDDFVKRRSDLAFYPYDQIHQFNSDKTKSWSEHIKQSLDSEVCRTLFDNKGILRIPFKPLVGIKAPAIAFEAGLKSKDDWQNYIEPIATSLHSIITKTIE
jgi:N-acetylmuramoyl-L-alanine amidase